MRRHRLVFFLGLYLACVAGLYLFVGVRDSGHGARLVARLALPAVELGLCALLCALFLRLARRGPRWPWLVACWAVAALAAVVYAAQVYSLYLSRNFISVLALENADSVAFVASPTLLAAAFVALAWLALFCVASRLSLRDPAGAVGAERWGWPRFGAATSVAALVCVYALFLQDRNPRLEPRFQQAPIVNLAANAWHARMGDMPEPVVVLPVANAAQPSCFTYGEQGAAGRYPFQQRKAFQAPLPFPATRAAPKRPNVLVIFSEGVSARLLGAYGGDIEGLTPNLDALAARSMQVGDYFNHTAATFRGIEGSLSSGFSHAGGQGGWSETENQAGLARIRRQTVPKVLGAAGYESYFFAPHMPDRPIIRMLRTLGFDRVFDYRSIDAELLDGAIVQRRGTAAATDQSVFRGLVAFLRQREATAGAAPFFAATYNIGTHAFIASAPGDVDFPGDNAVLDKLHNFDAAFGEFLRYFEDSPYASNTILVFTSDHATYPEPPYREVAGAGLKPYFVDRIPLLVLDPRHALPRTFDAGGRNSLDLAPTLLHLAGVQTRSNSFLGRSLFEPRNFPAGIAAIASKYYLTTPDGVFAPDEVPPEWRRTFGCQVDVVRRFYELEQENRIFGRVDGSGAPLLDLAQDGP